MHSPPRSRRTRVLASVLVAIGIGFAAPGSAAADAPNAIGVAKGAAQATTDTPACETNQRPAGAGQGRKIG